MTADDRGPFWLVWNPQGNSPQARHPTEVCALNEATRLARLTPGARFYVLCAVAVVEKQDVHVTRLWVDIPF